MKKLLNSILGKKERKIKNSEFSKFIYDASPTQKKKLIEEVIHEANRDQRELVQRVERLKDLRTSS